MYMHKKVGNNFISIHIYIYIYVLEAFQLFVL